MAKHNNLFHYGEMGFNYYILIKGNCYLTRPITTETDEEEVKPVKKKKKNS